MITYEEISTNKLLNILTLDKLPIGATPVYQIDINIRSSQLIRDDENELMSDIFLFSDCITLKLDNFSKNDLENGIVILLNRLSKPFSQRMDFKLFNKTIQDKDYKNILVNSDMLRVVYAFKEDHHNIIINDYVDKNDVYFLKDGDSVGVISYRDSENIGMSIINPTNVKKFKLMKEID